MSKSVAIVTGASQGIGQSTAIRLARDFSALVLVARNRANLEKTAEAVKAAGAEALIIEKDLAEALRKPSSIRRWPPLAASTHCSTLPGRCRKLTSSR
jgi:short-subunit dehydrogenase